MTDTDNLPINTVVTVPGNDDQGVVIAHSVSSNDPSLPVVKVRFTDGMDNWHPARDVMTVEK